MKLALLVVGAVVAVGSFVACTGDDPVLSNDVDSGVAAPTGPATGAVVKCGGSTCSVPSTLCCDDADGGGACKAAAQCTTNPGGRLACDSKDDCPAGSFCCATTDGASVLTSECRAGASCGQDFTLCAFAADCPFPGDQCIDLQPEYRPQHYQFCHAQ